MSLPPPPAPVAVLGPVNPLEAMINSLNTNTYLIGISMILLNLGGRHLSLGLTPEQDRFFQNPWIRRGMLFVVIFVATRNLFTALWLSIALIMLIGYLLNEHSDLYLFGDPTPLPPPVGAPPPITTGLTPEESDILKRLHDKAARVKAAEDLKRGQETHGAAPGTPFSEQLTSWYKENMAALRKVIS